MKRKIIVSREFKSKWEKLGLKMPSHFALSDADKAKNQEMDFSKPDKKINRRLKFEHPVKTRLKENLKDFKF